ncbi:MAG: YitT family protein [Halanaerobiales bacterium]|nr:YitT family protein [Halanaerobiales bacterium]
MNIDKKRFIKDYLMITVGAIITALSLVILTVPNKIAAGGVSGVATILYHMFGFKVGIVILVINVPLFLVAIYVLGGRIGIKTLWGIIVLSLTVDILSPVLQPLTNEFILASIYGGVLAGVGMGLVFRGGGTTGGTDLIAALTSYFFPHFSIGQGLFLIDGLVIALAGIVFDVELALYAAITIFVSTKIIDIIQEGFNISKSVFIISDNSKEIKDEILIKMRRGVTALKGYGGYSGRDKDVLMVTINRAEITKLKNLIREIDEDAFVIMNEAHEVLGEGFKRINDKAINE